jgi:hypothetical protein
MTTMKKSLITGILLVALGAAGCLDMGHDGHDVICTTDFRMLMVTVRDSTGHPVLLDEFNVTKSATGQVFNLGQFDPYFDSINRVNGQYMLLTDGQFQYTTLKGDEFVFRGLIDSTEVVREKYILGNDRCHVRVVSGNLQIVVK